MSEELERQIRAEATLEPSIDDDRAVLELAERVVTGQVPDPEAFTLPARPTLKDYVGLALDRHPRIQRAIRSLEALGMRVPQVTAYDDPTLNFIPPTDRLVETAAGKLDASLALSQKVPFPGKLSTRGRIAEQVVRMALENLRSVRLQIVSEVKKAYYSYYRSTVSIRVTRDSETLLKRIRAVAEGKYRAGGATQEEVLRAEVDLYGLSVKLLDLERQRHSSAARLNMLMDRDVLAPLPEPETFDPERVEWELDELLGRAVAINPELQSLKQAVRRDLEARSLARLGYFPDLVLGGGYSFISQRGVSAVANGRDIWNLNLGVTLPIWWHRIRARVLEQNAEALASALEYRSTRNTIFFLIQDSLVRVRTDYESALLFRDSILPRARQTVEVSESGYQAGRVDFLTLVDNWRKYLDFTLQYHGTLADLERDFAELEALVGGALPRVAGEEE